MHSGDRWRIGLSAATSHGSVPALGSFMCLFWNEVLVSAASFGEAQDAA